MLWGESRVSIVGGGGIGGGEGGGGLYRSVGVVWLQVWVQAHQSLQPVFTPSSGGLSSRATDCHPCTEADNHAGEEDGCK